MADSESPEPEAVAIAGFLPPALLLRSFVNTWSRHARECLLVRCACARRFSRLLHPDEVAYIGRAEAIADGRATTRRREPQGSDPLTEFVKALTYPQPDGVPDVRSLFPPGAAQAGEAAAQKQLVRDVFGECEPTGAFDPRWRTSDAVAVAWHMYDSGDFSAMPILADALQDAGCDREEVLAHCRTPSTSGPAELRGRDEGPHVRGCWVVDEVLELRAEPARLREFAETDPLTALGNRRAFDFVLAEAVRRSAHTPLALAHLDIDHLKALNRDHGHLVADRLLSQFGRCVRRAVREPCLLARTSGDGFHLILPATDRSGALRTAEQVRAAVAADNEGPVPCRVSVGVAVADPGRADAVLLREGADRALYEANRLGRNCVCG